MKLRELRESDIPRLKELHKIAEVPCPFPDTKELLPMTVIVDENDRVVMAVGCMPAVELYFFCDHDWETPGMRQEAFRIIHELVRVDLKIKGFIEAHAFIPPNLEKNFGRRLRKLGWIRSYWPCFSRRTD